MYSVQKLSIVLIDANIGSTTTESTTAENNNAETFWIATISNAQFNLRARFW